MDYLNVSLTGNSILMKAKAYANTLKRRTANVAKLALLF
jgi:hypothetical protein